MKTSVVVLARNFEYGLVSLRDRSIFCLNSLIDSFDEVSYVDWGSPNHSLLYDIKDHLNFKGNLKHFVITPEVAEILTGGDPKAQKPCEVLARNIGIRRSTGDWIVSTNIDIISPSREELTTLFNSLDRKTMYTISRRGVDFEEMKQAHNLSGHQGDVYSNWKYLKQYLDETSEPRKVTEKIAENDDYSIINCCGDFQCATKEVWNTIKGFEEDLIYTLYSDTNVQMKSVMHGYGLKALFDPGVYHIDHGPGGGGFMSGLNPVANDPYRALGYRGTTLNKPTWEFSDIEIEYEIL